jgi:hypothetical protein
VDSISFSIGTFSPFAAIDGLNPDVMIKNVAKLAVFYKHLIHAPF